MYKSFRYLGFLCYLDLYVWWCIYCTLFLFIYDSLLLDVHIIINHRNMFPAKNEEFVRLRMKDAIATTVLEELSFNNYAEFAWAPHDFHYNR